MERRKAEGTAKPVDYFTQQLIVAATERRVARQEPQAMGVETTVHAKTTSFVGDSGTCHPATMNCKNAGFVGQPDWRFLKSFPNFSSWIVAPTFL
jgi:hypothetical protein